ncbi:AraC family transcriptional regulator ligand-binding domain-containing protein [Nocardia sp. NPDC005366]|uniref:AraC family transcriptional regulator n=1 Tax=Nocardia sp. NPDC005366 TaxID=3156878 RepID=UPI0033B2331E
MKTTTSPAGEVTAVGPSGPGDEGVLFALTGETWDHARTMAGVSLLCEWAVRHGSTIESVLSGSHIAPESLDSPHELMTARQEITVIRNILSHHGGRHGIGTEIGRQYHLTTYGYFGYLLVTSGTVREMVSNGLRYAPLSFALSEIRAHVTGSGWFRSTYSADYLPEPIRDFAVERDMAASIQIQRELFTDPDAVRLVEVRFASAEPREPDAIQREYFAVPVSFGHPVSELVYETGYLDTPLPLANRHTASVMVDQCERIRSERLRYIGVTARIRELLLTRQCLDLTLEDVAAELHYAPRTLRRYLHQEGTSFREVVEEVRRSLAYDLLRERAVPREEVARRLGYHDWSSLARALRRWKMSGLSETPRPAH